MSEKKLINIVPLEKDGWYLTRQIHNNKGLSAIETKPLNAVKVEEEPKPLETEQKPICFHVTRVQDEDGKYICSSCGKKLGSQKPNYCPECGGKFIYGDE